MLDKRKQIVAAVVLVLAMVAAYWWYSPVLTLHQMQQRVASGDADGLNRHIDYPALRESLRGQFSASMVKHIGNAGDNPFAALGTMFGMALVNQMIDAMVRPETLAAAMATGRMKPPQPGASAPEPAGQRKNMQWATERKGTDRLIAYPHEEGKPPEEGAPGFVFVRHGFADWKLSEIRLQLDQP